MPFRLRNGGRTYRAAGHLDDGLTEQTKPEALEKAAQIKDYYMKQDIFLEKYHALYQILKRSSAISAYDDPAHQGDRKAVIEQLGYQIEGISVRERKMRDDACSDLVEYEINDLAGLKKLFISQGMLQAGYKAEMELERQKYLREIPEDDPLREQKADYLVIHSDGSYSRHNAFRDLTTLMIDELEDVAGDAYKEFAGQYQDRTGKEIGEMSLQELADALEIPEERREAFYRKFDADGALASPDDKFTEVLTAQYRKAQPGLSDARLQEKLAGRFYGEFYAEMTEKGIRMARAIMPKKKQKLMDAGRRFENDEELYQREQAPDLKAWIEKEGR